MNPAIVLNSKFLILKSNARFHVSSSIAIDVVSMIFDVIKMSF